jgi:ubiquinone/menaquinone biosynthesis C-methylase UbiE
MSEAPRPPGSVLSYYESFDERERLSSAWGQIELLRTQEILKRHLPPAPARVLDVGGAAGRYSLWLAREGYEAHLVDPVPRLVEQAREAARLEPGVRLGSCRVGDARALDFVDEFADAVILLGPLYHLTNAADRCAALAEAARCLRPGGKLFAAAISRFASALDGILRGFLSDPEFVPIVERDLAEGQHRNTTGRIEYFTESYFHRPEELGAEMEQAGLEHVETLAVEGIGVLSKGLAALWEDEAAREAVLEIVRRLESEPSLLGASPHLLGIARRPA